MNTAAPKPGPNMGEPHSRIDARLKVMGEATFPADIPVAGLAYAAFATSTIARGEIEALDVEAARAVPGVIAVFSHRDLAGQLEKPKFGNAAANSIAPLDGPEIFYDGQPIALVVAEGQEAAEEGAALVTASYRARTPSASFDDDGAQIIPAAGTNKQFAGDAKAGDFAAAYAAAPVKIDQRYSTPAQHHNPMELFSTTASWSDGKLTVNEPSQNVAGWKVELARQLRVPADRVRVVSPYIGGAFGSKGPMTSRTAIVAWAARRLGRPVRCVLSRMQAYGAQTYRQETRHRIRMGATPDGRITAFAHEGWEVTSRSDNYVVGGTGTTGRLYNYGSVLTKVSLVKADRNTPGYMRSPPETPYVYAVETAMDEMAIALGMDPVEFRRINDARTEPVEGRPFTSRSLIECYDQAASAFKWRDRNPAPRSMRDGAWLVGMGCATAVYPTNIAPCTARLRLEASGAITIECASHELGTGIRTVAAQLVSEQLDVPMEHIEVRMGDSNLPPAPVSGGSNSTASVCSALLLACSGVKNKLFAALASRDGLFNGQPAVSLQLKQGDVVAANGQSAPLKEALAMTGTIEHFAEFSPQGSSPQAIQKLFNGQIEFQGGEKGDKVKYAFGAEFVEVRVHALTGEIRVPRMVGAFAAGRIMNTRTARSQLMGGMIWGISSALHEATEIDRQSARYVNRDLQDYLVPVNADIGSVDVILVPEIDNEVNPAGVKGLGELGNVGTAAAISSAVYHATGLRFRDLPIRIDRFFA